jgi:hypothetical protein
MLKFIGTLEPSPASTTAPARGGCGSDDPGFGCAGGIALSFEDSARQPPSVGGAGAVAQRRDAAAVEVLDYWWRVLISTMRYSSPETRT